MSRHDQRPRKSDMTCVNCKNGDCNNCVDVTRILLHLGDSICTCTRKGHSGEPVDKQILDPETGDVYAPGLVVREDGTINGI